LILNIGFSDQFESQIHPVSA